MHRIDGPGATVDNKFTDGDPVGGVPATVVTDDWLNDVQENVMAVLGAAPVTPTKGRADDLLDAIRKIISAQAGHGQCRLKFVSATSLRLDPFGGRNLVINGVPRLLPAAGVTLNNGGLSASTLYYIYAFWTGSAIALEASATGHSQDSTTGVEIKTGDATRTLVGMIWLNASTQFADSPTARHVASYFSRRSVGAVLSRTGQTNFTSTSATEVTASDRVSFLCWGDEATHVSASGQSGNGTASTSVSVQSYVDGAQHGNLSAMYEASSNGGLCYVSQSSFPITGTQLSEGQHLAQVYAQVTSATGFLTYLANSVMTRI